MADQTIARRRTLSCSGRARRVLDHIDEQTKRGEDLVEDAARPVDTLTLPLVPGVYAYLRLPHPMRQHEWDQMLTVLEAMRSGIVREVTDAV